MGKRWTSWTWLRFESWIELQIEIRYSLSAEAHPMSLLVVLISACSISNTHYYWALRWNRFGICTVVLIWILCIIRDSGIALCQGYAGTQQAPWLVSGDIRIAHSLKHWVGNWDTLGSNTGHDGACCEYELLTFILAPTSPIGLRLRRSKYNFKKTIII